MICGLNFTTAAGASIACLSNAGFGLDLTGPTSNFSHLTAAAKWVCSFLMLFGRLEIYSVLLLFSPVFWKG
jgi:trk system potassium uptake protein TrkH